jgi:catechol 2,3-dioxygenase-like lactoylglutathione lyase family enzyme
VPTVRHLVRDVASAVGFYVDLLGFVEKERYGPAMAIVERDGLRLWLAGPTASAATRRGPAPSDVDG